jgi:hypothetical protein
VDREAYDQYETYLKRSIFFRPTTSFLKYRDKRSCFEVDLFLECLGRCDLRGFASESLSSLTRPSLSIRTCKGWTGTGRVGDIEGDRLSVSASVSVSRSVSASVWAGVDKSAGSIPAEIQGDR